MTTKIKTLSGTYSATYTLSQAYGALSITASGQVTGSAGRAGAIGAPPTSGYAGVLLPYIATITNHGRVTGGAGGPGLYSYGRTGYISAPGGVGVYARGGGRVINYSTITGGPGVIDGAGGAGVRLDFGAGLANLGVISGGDAGPKYYHGGPGGGGPGVLAGSGSHIVNRGLISGGTGNHSGASGAGIVANGAATITNYGTINAGATIAGGAGYGVYFQAGGVLTNGSASDHGASITGSIGIGLKNRSPTTNTNFGTIDGAGGTAVNFRYPNGHLYVDRLVAEAGSRLIGVAQGAYAALEVGAATGTISGLGAGTLSSAAGVLSGGISMTFSGFGSYIFDAGGVWTLTGRNVVYNSQSLTNAGVLIEQSGSLLAYRTVVNQGSVIGSGKYYAIELRTMGVLINGGASSATALVSSAGGGVYCDSHYSTGSYIAVDNYGTIEAATNGIKIAVARMRVANSGTIGGGGAYCGIRDAGGAFITNGNASDSSALISGGTGILGAGYSATTITNFGTIEGTGGVAVKLAAKADRLIDWAGGSFIGAVVASGGTLELAGVGGVIGDLGVASSFSGFGAYYFDLHSQWMLTGSDTLAASQTLTNGGSLAVSGTLTNNGLLVGRVGSVGTNGIAFAGYFGMELTGSGRVYNQKVIAGGEGGESNYGAYSDGVSFPGGAGGVGLSIALVTAGYKAVNYGTIEGGSGGPGKHAPFATHDIGGDGGTGGAGVALYDGGISNSGTIAGGAGGHGGFGYGAGGIGGNGGVGVEVASGTVTSTGTILGGAAGAAGGGSPHGVPGMEGDGVVITGAASLINGAAAGLARDASISGLIGLYAGAGSEATVTNFGTIGGARGVAVQFAASGDRLIEEAGGTFLGVVVGGGGTLELASQGGAGTIAGLDAAFAGFSTYAVDKGASWTLAGVDTLGAGLSLIDSGRLAIVGTMNNGGLVAASEGGAIILSGCHLSGPGEIIAESASSVVINGAYIQGGTLASAGTGKIKISGGNNTLDGQAAPVTLTGQVEMLNGSSLLASGSLTGSGRLWIEGSTKATQFTVGASLTLSGGGSIYLGNNASDAIVGSGGTLINVSDRIYGGGAVTGQMNLDNQANGEILADLAAGLTINIGSGSFSNEGLIEAFGHSLTIGGAVANYGRMSAVKGTLTVIGAITGTGFATIDGGALIADGTFTERVQFQGGKGLLVLAQSQTYTGRISGFSSSGGTSLDLRDIAFQSTAEATYSGTAAGGLLTVTDGIHTARIALLGNYTGSTFTASSDGNGGTIIIDPATGPPSPDAFIAAMAGVRITGSEPGPSRPPPQDVTLFLTQPAH